MNYLGNKLRELRESKGLLLRQVAAYIEVDTALVSKLERGERKANKDQVIRIAEFLEAEEKELMLLWLADKIADSIEGEDLGIEAIRFIEREFKR
ncbi:helix-turn-helix domain-containing protein [Cyclobacterium plantarum]|uniref:helix-turn-helix domain-containing protein n=1 Tax=Cyclobacterium plantarum TaxID=2716263 RepID=UPI003F6F3629